MQGNERPTQDFLSWRELKKEEPFEMLSSLDAYESLLEDVGFTGIVKQDRAEEFRRRIRQRYENFVNAGPDEMQRRFGIDNHGHFVERFGLTVKVLMAGDVVWGHMAATKP